jgi:UDP-2-acetamido-3-amino-2,3-dideoxy-glucuronate N-acetyltransferase
MAAFAKLTASEEVIVHPWALVESSQLGQGTRIGAFARVMKGARIGVGCSIGDHVTIESGAVLGDYVTISSYLPAGGKISTKVRVLIESTRAFSNEGDSRDGITQKQERPKAARIRANAVVGDNVAIADCVVIGRYAFVGSGAAVNHPVREFAWMAGNPARQIGWICVCGHKLPLPVSPTPGTIISCRRCGNLFAVAGENLELYDPLPPGLAENL